MNSEHLSREEFVAHMGPIRDDIREITLLLREQNSRIYKAESRLVVLEERNPPGRVATSGISAIVSGLITGLGMWLSNQK